MAEPLDPGHHNPPPAGYEVPPGGFAPPPGSYAPPPGSYAPPPGYQPPVYDPLISPDYSGWWQRATAIVRAGVRPLATVQAIGLLGSALFQVPAAVWLAVVSSDLTDGTTVAPDPAALFTIAGLTMLGIFLGVVVAALIAIAAIHVATSIASGATPDIGAAFRTAARRAFPLIGWQLLAGLIILVGICACILPGLYLAAVFTVLPAVVAFERGGVINRCFKLFHVDLGASVARVATIFGISVGVGVVGAVVGRVLDAALRTGADGQSGVIAGAAVSALGSAVLAAAAAVLVGPLTLATYADLRARVEPLNTAVLAQELGLYPPQTASGAV